MPKKQLSSSLKSVCQDNSDEKWDDIKLFLQSYDVERCSEDNATASLDALVESVVNHNSDNTNVGTSTTVHVHNDHMDVEGVSVDIGPATLECLVAAVENQKPDNDNVGTSNMQVDYSSTLSESAQVKLDVILKVIAASVDDVPIEVVPPAGPVVNQHISNTIEDQIEEQKQQFAFDGFLISDTMPSSVIEEFKQWVEEGLLKFHAKKKYDDDHYKAKSSSLGVHEIDFVVAHSRTKNWFYLMSQKNTCWNAEKGTKLRIADFVHGTDENPIEQNVADFIVQQASLHPGKVIVVALGPLTTIALNYIDKTYSRYYEDDTDTVLTTQQVYAESVRVALIEEAITHIIKGYCMPYGLPWHQVDEVYVPINCNENFHWVLAVIVLKDRRIRVYDSLSRRRNTKSITEIQKLAKMLPTYLSDNKFYDETSRTNWPNLETYRDKITQTTQILNEHPFDVEYVQHIMQQECHSVDCGVFVVGYAKYLSEEINVPSDGFEAEYHRIRYATLLQKYGIQKAKKGYVSENDDPPSPKSRIIQISDDNAIICIE
ncbi:hypothetical protein BC332_16031 [Capsicum chinense]|nr:hypothetical protein BC332_16031 [Capsicum chinense]